MMMMMMMYTSTIYIYYIYIKYIYIKKYSPREKRRLAKKACIDKINKGVSLYDVTICVLKHMCVMMMIMMFT
jgi:hypothetical protein